MWRTCAALVAVVVAPLTACAPGDGGGPQVVASFYPLQYVAERIVGPHASVTDLTAPGVEPHDLELSPRQVARISAARAVFYEKGLQPAVDDAVRNNGPDEVVDAAAVVPLRSGEGGMDPHFWLDPTLLARAAAGFTDAVVRADPSHAADYRKNLAALEADLATLDRDLAQGLAHCRTRTVVVSHDAFEYLGRRYGLDVQPIAGLSPTPSRPRGSSPSSPTSPTRTASPPSSPRPWPAASWRRPWPTTRGSRPRCSTRSRDSPPPTATPTTSR